MSKPQKILILLLAALPGLAIGFKLRSGRHRSEASNPARQASASAPVSATNRPARTAIADDSPLVSKLKQDLSISVGVKRWLVWLEALEQAGPSDFPRLARLAQGNPAAMQFLGARWADVAPRHLFDTLAAALRNGGGFPVNELARVLFEQWPRKDPEAAIAALNEPGDLGLRGIWRNSVAETVIRVDAERGLRLLAEWHIENYGPAMGAINKWAAANPQHAAEFTVETGLGFAAQETMEAIGKQWAKTDAAAALAFAQTHPGKLGFTLATATVKAWAAQDLERAGEWLAGAEPATRNRLLPSFLETWAARDTASALSWCRENLSGTSLVDGVSGVIGSLATKSPGQAASLVSEMEPSTARAAAAAKVANAWLPGLSSGKHVAPEMVTWLASLDNASRLSALGHTAAWDWATSDPNSMAAFLAQSPSESIPEYVDNILARQFAQKNPTEALNWANQLPGARGLETGATAFAEWRNAQPESAMKWFNELASDDPRRTPFFRSAMETLAWHPQAAEQLAAMTEPDRRAALGVIESLKLPDDRREALLSILKPTR
jgi:hypothetical protein